MCSASSCRSWNDWGSHPSWNRRKWLGRSWWRASLGVVLDVKVIAQVAYVDITIDHQALGEILQPRHPEAKVPLGIGDGELLPSLLLAIFRDVFARKGMALLAPEGSKELESSPPPRALAVGAAFVGLRRRDVQDARKFAHVIVLHRALIRRATQAQQTTQTRTPIYMQRSRTELKNCSIWLRNPIGTT
jgi:hypothetical protein